MKICKNSDHFEGRKYFSEEDQVKTYKMPNNFGNKKRLNNFTNKIKSKSDRQKEKKITVMFGMHELN